jgi:transcriptional regulator with XRE-family HTH domain
MPQVSTVRINGPALQELAARRGLTPPQLARKIGRHRQSVSRLMRDGGPTASRVFAYQLANALTSTPTEVDRVLAQIVLAEGGPESAAEDEPEAVSAA